MPSQPTVSKPAVQIMLAAAGLLAGCGQPKTDPKAGPVLTPPPVVDNHTGASKTTITPSTAPAAPADPVVATIGTTRVTHSELTKPLFEAYGFNMLMLVVQRDMARDAAQQQGLAVSAEDIKWEYNWTVEKMFPNLGPNDDREKLLDQFLAQPKPKDQTTTRAELGIIIETNAYLRKIVQPKINQSVTDAMLQQQFDETYGAQVQVRHIVTDNPQDAAAVQRRLAAGEDFATLARQVSRDPQTRRLGGELPPFTINSPRLPENFKRVAFDLKPGQVSDPVQAGGGYHLIKPEKRIAPKAVKFEDVKQSLREDYQANLVQQGVAAVRGQFAQQALAQLQITDPQLKAEFDSRLEARNQLIRDREKIRDQMEKDREAARTETTTPTTVPATTPTTTAPAATTQTVTPPVVPPTAPTTKPAVPPATAPTPVAPTPVPPPATAPVPTKVVVPPPPKPATQPATVPATQTVVVDPVTGLPVRVRSDQIPVGSAPVGIVQNTGGFTPAPAAAGATPSTQPATGPASNVKQ